MNTSTSYAFPSRRDFLKTSATLTGAALTGALASPRAVHAAGSDVIRIGLIGCGGRGTEAALNAMNAGKDVQVVALADIFQERLDASLARLQGAKPDQVAVKPEHHFIGFDAYQRLLACEIGRASCRERV